MLIVKNEDKSSVVFKNIVKIYLPHKVGIKNLDLENINSLSQESKVILVGLLILNAPKYSITEEMIKDFKHFLNSSRTLSTYIIYSERGEIPFMVWENNSLLIDLVNIVLTSSILPFNHKLILDHNDITPYYDFKDHKFTKKVYIDRKGTITVPKKIMITVKKISQLTKEDRLIIAVILGDKYGLNACFEKSLLKWICKGSSIWNNNSLKIIKGNFMMIINQTYFEYPRVKGGIKNMEDFYSLLYKESKQFTNYNKGD